MARTSDSSNTFWQSLRVQASELLLYFIFINLGQKINKSGIYNQTWPVFYPSKYKKKVISKPWDYAKKTQQKHHFLHNQGEQLLEWSSQIFFNWISETQKQKVDVAGLYARQLFSLIVEFHFVAKKLCNLYKGFEMMLQFNFS